MATNHKPTHITTPPQKLDITNMKAIKVLGKGAMGTVFLVHNPTSDPFALKVVDKSLVHSHPDALHRARWEISVLSSLQPHNHPFLPSFLGSFETCDLLGWALPFCPGSDLNSLRQRHADRVFSPSAIKFYLAEILCALEYLHSMGIAYRDLKPENVLVQSSGHVTLTDFDLSRKLKTKNAPQNNDSLPQFTPISNNKYPRKKNLMRILSYGSALEIYQKKAKSARVSPAVNRRRISFAGGKRSNSFVGTEEYVSPEVVRGEGHEFGVDWWALGVLAYEMLYGKTPFRGKNRKETFRNVVVKEPEFFGQRTELTDLIQRLLEKDPTKRLGYYRGAAEIKEHEFFKGVAWDLLTEVVRPPFVPDEDDSTEKVTPFDIRDYFLKQRAPASLPASPAHSLSSAENEEDVSLTDF